ncbi:MAG TPA: PQQ-binding-like beta-propeller repeat protein [Ktedonobacterales bacterium]|nr:PQQ-binding-like beta-propeller repeat protein [Ktedonobacterales bacterium]
MSPRIIRAAVPGPLFVLLLLPLLGLAACGSGSATTPCHPSGTATGTWPQANADYANTRDAAASLLSTHNVKALCVAWTFQVSGIAASGALATSPIVQSGIVYLQDLQSNVYAITLSSGTLKWEHRYNAANGGPNGVAVDQGMVFVESSMQTVAALDAATGTERWSWQIPQPTSQGIDQQLTASQGTLYLSTVPLTNTTGVYQAGSMGIIYALDEQTGSIKWSFNTVKDGDLWGNPQVNSGGGAWYPPAIDTRTGTTYWGIGNAAPFPGTQQYPNGSSRPGPNLYTDSELALTRSGQLQWYQQIKPHGLFDDDFQASPILTTAMVQGVERQVVIGSGKLGSVVAFDAQTGQPLWKTAVGQHHNDETQTIPAGQTITVLPGTLGGVETPMALSDGVVYVPIVNAAAEFSATTVVNQVLTTGTGELDALDVSTGKLLWAAPLKAPDFGGATVAGDLVFTSTFTGQVLAFNRSSGHQVWSWQAPTYTNGLLTVVGDTLLVPAGLGKTPMLMALSVGTTGAA